MSSEVTANLVKVSLSLLNGPNKNMTGNVVAVWVFHISEGVPVPPSHIQTTADPSQRRRLRVGTAE